MVKRANDIEVTTKEHVYGGEGALVSHILVDEKTMYGKNRLFNHCRLEEGAEVGHHVHTGDGEVYYILSGEGEFDDNGTMTTVHAGDVCWTPDGEGHSLKAVGGPLEFIALVVYSK